MAGRQAGGDADIRTILLALAESSRATQELLARVVNQNPTRAPLEDEQANAGSQNRPF